MKKNLSKILTLPATTLVLSSAPLLSITSCNNKGVVVKGARYLKDQSYVAKGETSLIKLAANDGTRIVSVNAVKINGNLTSDYIYSSAYKTVTIAASAMVSTNVEISVTNEKYTKVKTVYPYINNECFEYDYYKVTAEPEDIIRNEEGKNKFTFSISAGEGTPKDLTGELVVKADGATVHRQAATLYANKENTFEITISNWDDIPWQPDPEDPESCGYIEVEFERQGRDIPVWIDSTWADNKLEISSYSQTINDAYGKNTFKYTVKNTDTKSIEGKIYWLNGGEIEPQDGHIELQPGAEVSGIIKMSGVNKIDSGNCLVGFAPYNNIPVTLENNTGITDPKYDSSVGRFASAIWLGGSNLTQANITFNIKALDQDGNIIAQWQMTIKKNTFHQEPFSLPTNALILVKSLKIVFQPV